MQILVLREEGCERLTEVEAFEVVDRETREVMIMFQDGSTRRITNAVVVAGPVVDDEE